MSGPEFFQTRMGAKFYEVTMPRIADALEQIAAHLVATKKTNSYFVTPVRESQGEGNGWFPCRDAEATLFEVGTVDEVGGAYDTRAEAERRAAQLNTKAVR